MTRRRWAVAATVALAFVGHLLLSRPMDGVFLSDGTGYLANARWLAGRAGETFQGETGFYHPGYSLLLAPLFRLFDDPATIYQGILVVNAALAAASIVVYRGLALRLGLGPKVALLTGVVAALYPSILLQSSVEWSENLYHLGFGLLLVALHRLLRRQDALTAAAVSLLAVGLYATHPRGLGLLPVALLTFVVLAWRRILTWRTAGIGIATLALAFVATRALFAVLLDAMWATDRPQTEGDILSRLTDPALLWGMVKRCFGQAWYLLVATAGLGAAGLVKLARDAWAPPRLPATLFAQISLLAIAATFAASALMMADGTRVDHLVYGRYNEAFFPALLVFGATALASWTPRRVLLLGAGTIAAIALLGAATVALEGGERFAGAVAPLNVFGILVWETDRSAVDILRISLGAVAVTCVVLLVRLRALPLALVVTAAFFLTSALVVRDRVLGPFTEHWSSLHELPEEVRRISDDGAVTYDRRAYQPDPGNFYQFELVDRGVRFWDGDGRPPSDLVLSGPASLFDLGGKIVSTESAYDTSLWVLPGALQDRLAADGQVFPGALDAALPDEARRGRIDAPDQLRTEQFANPKVDVSVTHTGAGSPWADVRINATWPDGSTAEVVLDEVVHPGETVDVELVLPVHAPSGTYEVRLELVQGDAAFGGTTLTVEVR